MFLYQQKPNSGQTTTKQKKENSSSKEDEAQAPSANGPAMFKYWMTNADTMHSNVLRGPIGQANPIQKTGDKEKLEDKEPTQLRSELAAPTNNASMMPTVVPSKKMQKTAQRKEREEEIRQNKPRGMNDNTYLKLSNPQECAKMVAQAKFMQFKKNQVKQLKRNKQASIQFNSKVKQFERTIVQNKIAYGSENYNTLLENYFPDLAGEQTNSPNNTVTQKKEAETPISANTNTENTEAENKTGLPDNLKTGVEQLSGMDISDVQVHRNSNKPAQMQAHAFAQGTDIHLAPGQEKHLPHEAWHVVQQKQGRVKPTVQMKEGVTINDDEGLEKEADVMGEKSLQLKPGHIADSKGGKIQYSDNSKVSKPSINSIQRKPAKVPESEGTYIDSDYKDLELVLLDVNKYKIKGTSIVVYYKDNDGYFSDSDCSEFFDMEAYVSENLIEKIGEVNEYSLVAMTDPGIFDVVQLNPDVVDKISKLDRKKLELLTRINRVDLTRMFIAPPIMQLQFLNIVDESDVDELRGMLFGRETGLKMIMMGAETPMITTTPSDYKAYEELTGMTISELNQYTHRQADWHASPQLEKIQISTLRRLTEIIYEPGIAAACGHLPVAQLKNRLDNETYIGYLKLFARVAHTRKPFTVDDLPETLIRGIAYGMGMKQLIDGFGEVVLEKAMTWNMFRLLAGKKLFKDVVNYYTACTPRPIFQAENGADFYSYYKFRTEDNEDPLDYKDFLDGYVRNLHRFTAGTLLNLSINITSTPDESRPLTLILHSAIDHNGAFHRSASLETIMENSNILPIMYEGAETLDAIVPLIGFYANKFGVNGKIDQVMILGHGGARTIELAGTVSEEAGVLGQVSDAIDLDGNKAKSDLVFDELIKYMAPEVPREYQTPGKLRILFNACLTNSNKVQNAVASKDNETAKVEVLEYLKANKNLTIYLMDRSEDNIEVVGANASTNLSGESTITEEGLLEISSEKDPSVGGTKQAYILNGHNPEGVMRAVIEEYAINSTRCLEIIDTRLKDGPFENEWDDAIIKFLFQLIKGKYSEQLPKIVTLTKHFAPLENLKFKEHCTLTTSLRFIARFEAIREEALALFNSLAETNTWKRHYIPLVMLQAWMNMDELKGRDLIDQLEHFTCQTAQQFLSVDILAKYHVFPLMFNRISKGATIIAVIGALKHQNQVCISYLLKNVNVKTRKFNPEFKLLAALGGYTTELKLLQEIGIEPKENTVSKRANVRLYGDDDNRIAITPLSRYSQFYSIVEGTEIYLKPNESSELIDRAGEFISPDIIGETDDWYAIDLATFDKIGTGFVKKEFLVRGEL